MKTITISASFKAFGKIPETKDELERLGFDVETPDMTFYETGERPNIEDKQRLTMDFFPKIDKADAVLILTGDDGYIGKSVSLEIGYAHAKGIPVYYFSIHDEPGVEVVCRKIDSLEEIAEELG